MELTRQTFPKRAVVKCKAKIRLLADPIVGLGAMTFDDELFLELARNLLRIDSSSGERRQNRADELYQSCENPQAARQIEEKFIRLLVEAYKQIKIQQQDPIVQQLNALL